MLSHYPANSKAPTFHPLWPSLGSPLWSDEWSVSVSQVPPCTAGQTSPEGWYTPPSVGACSVQYTIQTCCMWNTFTKLAVINRPGRLGSSVSHWHVLWCRTQTHEGRKSDRDWLKNESHWSEKIHDHVLIILKIFLKMCKVLSLLCLCHKAATQTPKNQYSIKETTTWTKLCLIQQDLYVNWACWCVGSIAEYIGSFESYWFKGVTGGRGTMKA